MIARLSCRLRATPVLFLLLAGGVSGATGGDEVILYVSPPVTRALEFDVDPRSLRDANRLTLSSGADVSVEWIYLIVKH